LYIKKRWFLDNVLSKFFKRAQSLLDDEDYSQMYAAWRVSHDIQGAFTAVEELFQLNPCLFRKPGAASEDIQVCHIVSDAPQLDDTDTTQSVSLDPQEFAAQNLEYLCKIETQNNNAEAAGRLLALLHAPPGGVSLRNKKEISSILAEPIAIRSQIIHRAALDRALFDSRYTAKEWEDWLQCVPLEDERMEQAVSEFKNIFMENHMHESTRENVEALLAVADRASTKKKRTIWCVALSMRGSTASTVSRKLHIIL
jgi:hypothetical protein